MREILKNSAVELLIFMADAADHLTGKTGLTLAVELSKNAGALVVITPDVVERGYGWYAVSLVAANTDTEGDLLVRCTAAGADPGERTLCVYTKKASDVGFWRGTQVPVPHTAGYPVATIKQGIGVGELLAASGILAANIMQLAGTDQTDGFNLATRIDAAISTRLAPQTAGRTLAVGVDHNVNLDAAYNAAKTAASQSSVDALAGVPAVVDAINSSMATASALAALADLVNAVGVVVAATATQASVDAVAADVNGLASQASVNALATGIEFLQMLSKGETTRLFDAGTGKTHLIVKNAEGAEILRKELQTAAGAPLPKPQPTVLCIEKASSI